MMIHDEPWQVFTENGTVVAGRSATPEEFAENSSLIMGAAHVWLWRRGKGEVEVLLQKRAVSVTTWPSYYDVSTAGHIDHGETAVESAVREAREELGIDIEAETLRYLFSLRTPLTKNEIDHVYVHEVTDDIAVEFSDGEVELVEWLSLSILQDKLKNPGEHKIVNQGHGYFTLLLDYLKQL